MFLIAPQGTMIDKYPQHKILLDKHKHTVHN